MKRILVPAHVHYEVLLQILERQTFPLVQDQDGVNRARVQDVINSLRKAFSQQQQLEADWKQRGYEVDYRWTLDP